VTRVRALLAKEFADLRHNPGVFLPALLTAAISMALPFFVAVAIPAWTGERLSDSSDLQVALDTYRSQRIMQGLDPEAMVQAWIFQQFLPLLVLAPVAASMSVAAYTVIGEKQARTLEPLLATPITTFELLLAKVLGALIPAVENVNRTAFVIRQVIHVGHKNAAVGGLCKKADALEALDDRGNLKSVGDIERKAFAVL